MRILIVDPEDTFREELVASIEGDGYAATSVASSKDAVTALDREEFDVLFTGIRLDSGRGPNLLAESRSRWPRMLVVITAEAGTVEDAVNALHAGAFDYLRRPVRPEQIRRVLDLVRQQLALSTAGAPVRDPVEYAQVLASEGGYEVLLIAPPPIPRELPGVTPLEPEQPSRIRDAVEDFAMPRERVAVVLAAVEELLARHREDEVASLLGAVRELLEGKGPLAVGYDPTKMTATGALAVRASITSADAEATLESISSPIRRMVLRRLGEGECTFTQALEAARLDDTSLIAFHLRKLVDSGLIEHLPEKKYRLSERGRGALDILSGIDGLEPGKGSGNQVFAVKPRMERPP